MQNSLLPLLVISFNINILSKSKIIDFSLEELYLSFDPNILELILKMAQKAQKMAKIHEKKPSKISSEEGEIQMKCNIKTVCILLLDPVKLNRLMNV